MVERLTFFEGGHWRIRLNGTVYSDFPEIDRLAAYEDTGLEPEGIKALIPPPNAPLTLEELREMDGEPVWVVELNDYPPHWGLVYWCRKNKRNIVYVTINNGASICAETFIAAGGKIYRRKPEEGTIESVRNKNGV